MCKFVQPHPTLFWSQATVLLPPHPLCTMLPVWISRVRNRTSGIERYLWYDCVMYIVYNTLMSLKHYNGLESEIVYIFSGFNSWLTSILWVLLKQYRSPTGPNKFKFATYEKVSRPWRKSNLICNSSYRSLLPTVIQICESITMKSPENWCDGHNFEERAISHEKVGQPRRKSNLICNSSHRSLLATFIQICESIAKKSPENWCDGQNLEERAITREKVGRLRRKSNLICNSSYRSLLPTFIYICESIRKKSAENWCDRQNFEERAITHEKVGQPWRKSNLTCNSSYRRLPPTFIRKCESIVKKNLENECDRQTDWRTDWQTECKPIVPSGFTGGGLKTNHSKTVTITQFVIQRGSTVYPGKRKIKLNLYVICLSEIYLSMQLFQIFIKAGNQGRCHGDRPLFALVKVRKRAIYALFISLQYFLNRVVGDGWNSRYIIR